MSLADLAPVRCAGPTDVDALAAMYMACAVTLGPQVYSPQQVSAWRSFGADHEGFRDYVLQATTWIACDERQRPLGFCGVNGEGEVKSLYVRPDLMRRGIGSALLAHALVHSRGAGLTAFTAWATPFSVPVFQRAGFELDHVSREPYQGVMFDRYRMRLGAISNAPS